MKPTKINKGDTVTYEGPDGNSYTGTVISAVNWAFPDNWYIEVALIGRGYAYWKQDYDGGKLVSHIPQGGSR